VVILSGAGRWSVDRFLRERVEALLLSNEVVGNFLESSPAESGPSEVRDITL